MIFSLCLILLLLYILIFTKFKWFLTYFDYARHNVEFYIIL